MKLNENLRENDLEYLVDSFISIDQYTSKIDEDNITIAFFCNEKDVAEDLKDFIEKTYYIEIRDIEISDSLTEDNKYTLFVELERNSMFPEIILDIVDSISYLTNNDKWTFKTLENKNPFELSIDNIKKYVRLTKYKNMDKKEDVKENKNSIIKLKKDWYEKEFIDEGYVSEEEMEKIISETPFEDMQDDLITKLLEYNYPSSQIIIAGNKVFIVGDKIQMLKDA